MADDLNIQNEINGILKPEIDVPQASPLYPSTQVPQTSPMVPPIQTTQNPQTYSQFQEPTPVTNKSGVVTTVVVLLILTAVGSVFYYFRTQLLGPLSYADCMKIEGSTQVALEPKYCVTPEGKIFFENRKLVPSKEENTEQTFAPDGPTTNPPN